MKYYPDQSLKNQILDAVYQLNHHIYRPATARNIRNFIEYQGSKSNFKSEIYGLKRRGYISFAPESKNKTVKRYILTKKGNFHRLNPGYFQKMKAEKIKSTVYGILNDDEQFTEAVDNEVENRMDMIEKNVETILNTNVNEINIANANTSKAETTVGNIIKKKNKEISTWKSKYFEETKKRSTDTKSTQNTKTTEKKTNDEARINNRKKLAQFYYQNRLWIDVRFFQHWKNMVPVLLSGKKFLNKRSVEIMSTDEAKRELERKHARAVLQSNDEILACFFRIDKINKDGIVVKSNRLDLKKNMNW